ncbi:heavy metal translocating P-type ATPase [uncultured Friedmanniella sp.]|uniref:heavy metal translocating P-type ATPase n=1 Tax=uncultured Friedmanniella sp. TaxID=335381 RepID=UPI0035CB9A39
MAPTVPVRTSTAGPAARQLVELDVTGMTCASCAARIEKKLNRMDGVHADVNYATERATVHAPAGVDATDLIATIERTGYGASRSVPEDRDPGASLRALRRRTLVAGVLAAPVVVLGMVPAAAFPGSTWLALLLTLGVVGWAGWPFHRGAALNLRHGSTTMDTLISLGTLAATIWSIYALLAGTGHLYLEVAAGVTTLVLLGRYLEARAKRRAGAAVRALLELTPAEATVLHDGVEQRVPAATLRTGDRFVVRPGETFAADGQVLAGRSAADTSMVTGEVVPVELGVGDAVVGGCLNTYGRLEVAATHVGADSQLAQIARLVEAAQSGKAAVQRLADRISSVFVPVVMGLALLTLAGWLLSGSGASTAFSAAVAVLIIACPCALGLATPTALLVGTGRGAQLGIVIRGPEVLESSSRIDTVVLDKTGTVTEGRMSVVDVIAVDAREADVLRLAGAAESGSEHPIARAIAAHAAMQGPLPVVRTLTNLPGLGVLAELSDAQMARAPAESDTSVVVGQPELLLGEGLVVGAEAAAAYAGVQAAGRTAVLVGWDGAARGVLAVADTLKPTSAEAVGSFRALGLRPVLLTGDHRAAAEAVAAEVGIEEVVAGVRPEGKVAEVRRLQAAGHRVAMVGDGVNDAAALAQADLGIALGTGTDAAIQASDLTLVRGDLRAAAEAVGLARATLRTIKGNLFWAFAYNVAAIPLAASGLLNPLYAGAAMALSSLFVVSNSLRLRRFR